MEADARPTFLVTAPPAEVGVLRGLLEAQGIDVVVQGEHHGAMLPGITSPIELRLLVPEAQLERARKLLEDARPVLEGPSHHSQDLADAVCPVHEAAAVATCTRCGTFLCERCPSLGAPAVCEACVQRPTEDRGGPPVWVRRLTQVMVGGVGLLILFELALNAARVWLGW